MTRTSDELEHPHDHELAQEAPATAQQAKENTLSPEQEFVLARLASLDARNHELLAVVLRDYPELREAILAYAIPNLGNETVARALAIVSGQVAHPAGPTSDEDFIAGQIEQEAHKQDDAAFIDQHIAQEGQKSDEAFIDGQIHQAAQQQSDEAFIDGQIAQEGQKSDEAFIDSQIEQAAQHQNDEAFIDQQIERASHEQGDEAFISQQIEHLEQQQSDESFIDGQIAQEEQKSADVVAPAALDAEDKTALAVVETMTTNDQDLLAASLNEQPELRGAMVVAASEKLGADTVEQAIETQVEQQPEVAQEEAAAPELAQTEIEQAIEEPAAAAKQQDEWARKASDYNERHDAFVEEFHQLTGGQFRLPDGSVDPTAIMAFQQANDIATDGKIGPQTIATARAGAKKPAAVGPVAIIEQPEEIQDEPLDE